MDQIFESGCIAIGINLKNLLTSNSVNRNNKNLEFRASFITCMCLSVNNFITKRVGVIHLKLFDRIPMRRLFIKIFCIFFFYSCFHLYGNLPLTYPPPYPLFSFFPFLSPVTSATSFATARATFLPYRQSYPL